MKYTHSCILLHSFTSAPEEMIYFSKHITNILPKNMCMKYIYPKAPIRRISCFEGSLLKITAQLKVWGIGPQFRFKT